MLVFVEMEILIFCLVPSGILPQTVLSYNENLFPVGRMESSVIEFINQSIFREVLELKSVSLCLQVFHIVLIHVCIDAVVFTYPYSV